MLAQAGGWQLQQAQRGITARRVVQQAMHALRRLGDALGGTLAPQDFVRTAAAAVDALAERAGGSFILQPLYILIMMTSRGQHKWWDCAAESSPCLPSQAASWLFYGHATADSREQRKEFRPAHRCAKGMVCQST